MTFEYLNELLKRFTLVYEAVSGYCDSKHKSDSLELHLLIHDDHSINLYAHNKEIIV